jgi:hypothetical protein
MNIEIVGYLASAVTMFGFTRSKVNQIRLISGISCLIWIVYGALLGSSSIIIMNFALILLHLFKSIKKDKDEKL